MALNYHNLDDRTRQLMLDEMDYDIAHNQLHISPFLVGRVSATMSTYCVRRFNTGTMKLWRKTCGHIGVSPEHYPGASPKEAI